MLEKKQDSRLGQYLFPSVEIKLNVLCFYALQDFMSSVFMLYETSVFFVLCFARLHVFCFFIIYETSMSFVVMFYNTWMSYVFMSYRTSGSSILRFYRTTRSLFLSYKTSMSFCFINFTILFSQSCNIELQNHSNEISVIIFT